MEGVRSYDCSKWHPDCDGVSLHFDGVSLVLWCPVHRTVCNLEAVSPKLQGYASDPYSAGAAKVLVAEGPVSGMADFAKQLVAAVRAAANGGS
jgi:hypothetical protein